LPARFQLADLEIGVPKKAAEIFRRFGNGSVWNLGKGII
jgi:hypothetical protein